MDGVVPLCLGKTTDSHFCIFFNLSIFSCTFCIFIFLVWLKVLCFICIYTGMYTWVCLIPKSKQLGTFSCLTNGYVRRITCLFWFVSRLSTAFILLKYTAFFYLKQKIYSEGIYCCQWIDRKMDSHFGLLDFTSFTPCFMVWSEKCGTFLCCAELMIKLH